MRRLEQTFLHCSLERIFKRDEIVLFSCPLRCGALWDRTLVDPRVGLYPYLALSPVWMIYAPATTSYWDTAAAVLRFGTPTSASAPRSGSAQPMGMGSGAGSGPVPPWPVRSSPFSPPAHIYYALLTIARAGVLVPRGQVAQLTGGEDGLLNIRRPAAQATRRSLLRAGGGGVVLLLAAHPRPSGMSSRSQAERNRAAFAGHNTWL
jgi:hypothetical protein